MTDDGRGRATVVTGLEQVEPGPSAITIGNFDGVHRGHRALLDRAVAAAARTGSRAVAVTFDPHPAAVLRPGSEPLAIGSLEERCARLIAVGIDLVVVLPFTRELAALSPDAFVEHVLVDPLGATRVVVGTNFRYGHKAAGDLAALTAQGEHLGFDVEPVALLELDGIPLSSSAVRQHVRDGELAWVTRALGRPFAVAGEVVRGDQRGRTIGFPTANVEVPGGRLLPGNGVYAGVATVGGQRLPAVTNVGTRPTFAGEGVTVEVHLLDVTRDLYGHHLEVTFLERLRGERRFDGIDALRAQIAIDAEAARARLADEV